MLFPIAPHISEYLWNTFEVEGPNIESSWPEFEATLIEAEEFELIIQVNGKVRGRINLNKNSSQDMVEQAALTVENVKNFIGPSEIKKTIYVKEKLINFVI
jgi:leucyl-tRNA synthetase